MQLLNPNIKRNIGLKAQNYRWPGRLRAYKKCNITDFSFFDSPLFVGMDSCSDRDIPGHIQWTAMKVAGVSSLGLEPMT